MRNASVLSPAAVQLASRAEKASLEHCPPSTHRAVMQHRWGSFARMAAASLARAASIWARGGVFRQALFGQLHQFQPATARKALGVLGAGVQIEFLLQFSHTENQNPEHNRPPYTRYVGLNVSRGATSSVTSPPTAAPCRSRAARTVS